MRRLCVVILAIACSQPASRQERGPRPPPQRKAGALTISVVGTNDLHGALDRLPLFAGYVANLRAARAADGGGVVLLDGGDMFQGTLESNINEGADVVRAYNEIGYTAAAVGNHEFDYGPEGPAATPATIEDDARGALKARAREAKFPLLVANISDQATGARIKWPNMPASTIVEVSGIKIGIIGASTESTPYTTMSANFAGLVMKPPPAVAITAEAKTLRAQGAQLILVTAHIGTMCKDLDHPNDASSCERNEELYKLIDDLPKNTVDVIVGGHTHAGIAHRIKDIAVIESFSSGRAFGRIDLRVSPDGHVTSVKIHKPRMLCEGEADGTAQPIAKCKAGEYEGKPVTPVATVQSIVDASLAKANVRRNEKLGVTLSAPVAMSYYTESAQGNWITDLMRQSFPQADVALTNGGGLRADLPAGELTYGQLFAAVPFDNRYAIVKVQGSHLRKLVSTNLQRGGAMNSWSGLTAKARCKAGKLDLEIKVGGKPLVETAPYTMVTSDFLASGTLSRIKLADGAVTTTDLLIRDAIADLLRKTRGTLDPTKLFSPTVKRMDYEGTRPVECGPKQAPKEEELPE